MTEVETLLERYEGFIVACANRAAYNEDEFQDFAQTARVRLVENRHQISKTDPKSYCMALIKNTVTDCVRREAKRNGRTLDIQVITQVAVAPDDIESVDTILWIERILREMPPKYRKAVVAVAQHGEAGIAAVSLGITTPALKSSLYRAREIAKRHL